MYSVSVMLYEMLAARPPFMAKNPNGLFAMHLASLPPPLKDLQPNLEQLGPLQELLNVGLQKQPEERFASAEVYLEHIDALLAEGFSGASLDPTAARPKPKQVDKGSATRSAVSAIAPKKSGPGWSVFRLSSRRRWLLGVISLALIIAGALLYGSMRP